MDLRNILSSLDHTLLSSSATWGAVRSLCDEAVEFGAASVCIPPCYVRDAAEYLGGRLPVCTVIGFPHDNAVTGAKLFEAKTAVMDGAAEVDMVANLGYVKDRRFDKVFSEISGIKAMVGEKTVLKVIVETCLLTDEEKVRMCVLTEQAGADFIKTSTGYAAGGATPEDVRLFSSHAGPQLKIKASGGIRTLEQAQHFLDLGASRIGASNLIGILKAEGISGRDLS